MAIAGCFLPILKTVLARVRPDNRAPIKALTLGYPDLLATREQLVLAFGRDIEAHLRPRADSDAVNAWHGSRDIFPEIYETTAFFAGLGVTLDCVDITAARGFERILDMNQPLPADMAGAYDLVLDPGTVEHCFHIAQAMHNCATALRVGGCVLHNNPLNVFNHGFYNVSPTFYVDFFAQNGFDVLMLVGIHSAITAPELFDVPPHGRFKSAPVDSSLLAVAQRRHAQPITWPTQHKYVTNPGLRA
jgi:hypothetical protein